MRIPNQLDRDNLYRRGAERRRSDVRPGPGGTAVPLRRIIRLLIVLALVVTVMRQANHPEVYEVFFPEPMETLTSTEPNIAESDSPTTPHAPQPRHLQAESQGVADATTIPAATFDIRQGNGTIENERSSAADVHSPSTLQLRTSAQLLSPAQRQQLLATLLGISDDPPVDDPSDSDSSEADPDDPAVSNDPAADNDWSWWMRAANRGEVVAVLLETMIDSAVDGTVWRAADLGPLTGGLAIHRLIASRTIASVPTSARDQPLSDTDEIDVVPDDQAGLLGEMPATSEPGDDDRPTWLSWPLPGTADTPASVGVLPLLQQPSVYRGRPVIAEGQLARMERVNAAANPLKIRQYWNLWLRPTDGSSRPWLTIVPDLPPGLDSLAEQIDGDVTGPLPTVQIHGEYLKRLAYASAAGVQTTPIVVGHVAGIRSNGHPAVAAGLRQWRLAQGEPAGPTATSPEARSVSESQVWLLLAATVLAGVCLAAVVMWQYSRMLRQSRLRRQRSNVSLPLIWLVIAGGLPLASAGPSQAESLVDLLGRFDRQSLQSLPLPAADSVEDLSASQWPDSLRGELAKLVYRMSRLSGEVLQSRASSTSVPPSVGDAQAFQGTISRLESVPVPPDLADVLDLNQFQRVRLKVNVTTDATDDASPEATLVSDLLVRRLPAAARPGDQLSGVGLVLRPPASDQTGQSDAGAFWVGGAVQWVPAEPSSPSQAVLAEAGVDVGGLPALARRSRQPLMSEDSDLFFPMIAAAEMAAESSSAAAREMRDPSEPVSPLDLLQYPRDWVGQWVEINLETVRWTRVEIESPTRRRQAGVNAYYQIDAMGDLGDVQLRIENADGEPVTMENRYPVTIVSAELPDFLRQAARDPDDLARQPLGGRPTAEPVIGMAKVPVVVSGFFYRLWSYQSEFMQARGGEDQFAPLIIAGQITDRSTSSPDASRIQWIGMFAAAGVALGIVATFWFGRVTSHGDLEARRRRQEAPPRAE